MQDDPDAWYAVTPRRNQNIGVADTLLLFTIPAAV